MKLFHILQETDWNDIKPHLLFYCEETLLHHYEQFHKKMMLRKPVRQVEPLLSIHINYIDETDGYDLYGRNEGDDRIYTLSFSLWEEWLSYNINEKTASLYSHGEIIAHCYWEMTYHGFREEDIAHARNELFQMKETIEKASQFEEKIPCLFCNGTKQTETNDYCTSCDENGKIHVLHF